MEQNRPKITKRVEFILGIPNLAAKIYNCFHYLWIFLLL